MKLKIISLYSDCDLKSVLPSEWHIINETATSDNMTLLNSCVSLINELKSKNKSGVYVFLKSPIDVLLHETDDQVLAFANSVLDMFDYSWLWRSAKYPNFGRCEFNAVSLGNSDSGLKFAISIIHTKNKVLGFKTQELWHNADKFNDDVFKYTQGMKQINHARRLSKGQANLSKRAEELKLVDANNIDTVLDVGAEFAPDFGQNQIIPKELWASPFEFMQPSLDLLYHPHLHLLYQESLKRWQPHSKTLLVCSCGIAKPYSTQKRFKYYKNMAEAGHFDIMVSSIMPVMIYPFDNSSMYPNVLYEWPHDESHELRDALTNLKVTILTDFVHRFNYDKIIFLYSHMGLSLVAKELQNRFGSDRVFDVPEIMANDDRVKEKYNNHPSIWRVRIFQDSITKSIINDIV